MTAVITVVIAAATLASLAFLLTYGLGARWWLNRIGRALMAQGLAIFAVFVYILFRRLTTHPASMPANTFALALGVYGLVALVQWTLAISFVRELRAWRKRDRRQPVGNPSKGPHD